MNTPETFTYQYSVRYQLAGDFTQAIKKIPHRIAYAGQFGADLMYYEIEADNDSHNIIADYAFMTNVANPVFQKYYHDSPAYKIIAKEYVDSRQENMAWLRTFADKLFDIGVEILYNNIWYEALKSLDWGVNVKGETETTFVPYDGIQEIRLKP
jgi:hypothetical protein